MALPLNLQVEGQHQGGALRLLGALDERGRKTAVAHYVKLEPERTGHRAGNVLDRADRHGRERKRHAEALGGARPQHFAVGPVQPGEPGGRDRHRHDRVLPGHRGAGAASVDVNPHALAQGDGIEIVAVGAQRRLGVGAAVDIVENRPGDAFSRHRAQIFYAGHHRHGIAFYNAKR